MVLPSSAEIRFVASMKIVATMMNFDTKHLLAKNHGRVPYHPLQLHIQGGWGLR